MPELPYPVDRYRRPQAQHVWPEWLGRSLRKTVRARGIELVLAFYSYPTGYVAVRNRRRLGVRVVVSPRGGDLYPNFHALKKSRVRSIIAHGYRHADRIVSPSRWITMRIGQVTGLPLDQLPPIDAVPNGLDLDTFDAQLAAAPRSVPEGLPFTEDERFLLHLGRVAPVKRVPLAIEAVARQADYLRQHQVKYAIVGDGADLDAVRQLVAQHRLGDVVHVLGRRVGPEKAWLLRHARGFVTTSREEGMPNALLEAMAAGLPTLASAIGPHEELLADRGWGLLCGSTDPAVWGDHMRGLLDADPAPMRAAALELREQYTLDRMLDGYARAVALAIS
jgi:glycosyltransferase involved in cell wall biosynthesis